jgi:hypothetical protein
MILVSFLFGPLARGQEPDPVQQFELGKSAFQYQDYKKAVSLLKPLLYPSVRLTRRTQVLKAREFLGASYWWLKQKGTFNQEMTAYLIMDPGAKLDPFFYPPELVQDFSNLKKRLLEMKIIKPVGDTTQNKVEPPRRVVIERTEIHRHPLPSWVPFGVGQFANEQTGKGILFLALEVVAIGVNVGAWTYMQQTGGGGGGRRAAIWTMYGSLGAFAVLAVLGIIDARVNYNPLSVREQRRLELTPPSQPPPGLFFPGSLNTFPGAVPWRP